MRFSLCISRVLLAWSEANICSYKICMQYFLLAWELMEILRWDSLQDTGCRYVIDFSVVRMNCVHLQSHDSSVALLFQLFTVWLHVTASKYYCGFVFVITHVHPRFNLSSPLEWTVNRDWSGCCLLPWEQQMCLFRPHSAACTHTLTHTNVHTWQCVH